MQISNSDSIILNLQWLQKLKMAEMRRSLPSGDGVKLVLGANIRSLLSRRAFSLSLCVGEHLGRSEKADYP